jgi:hypothetical protein
MVEFLKRRDMGSPLSILNSQNFKQAHKKKDSKNRRNSDKSKPANEQSQRSMSIRMPQGSSNLGRLQSSAEAAFRSNTETTDPLTNPNVFGNDVDIDDFCMNNQDDIPSRRASRATAAGHKRISSAGF